MRSIGCRRMGPPERRLGAVGSDPSELGPLYERYAQRVYYLARGILGSREEAEDLAQEVFVSVWQSASYDPARGPAIALLVTLTRSRAIDRLRRRWRSARLQESWHEATSLTTAPRTPFDHVSLRRAADRLRAALAELPDAERRVLEMAYYEGLSQSEIAADLDTPLGTVKTLARRGLSALRRALDSSKSASPPAGGKGRPAGGRALLRTSPTEWRSARPRRSAAARCESSASAHATHG